MYGLSWSYILLGYILVLECSLLLEFILILNSEVFWWDEGETLLFLRGDLFGVFSVSAEKVNLLKSLFNF